VTLSKNTATGKTLAFDAEACSWYYVEDGRPETGPRVTCHRCGQMTAQPKQEQSGVSYTCQDAACSAELYVSIGD
jgi:hypothetical protein